MAKIIIFTVLILLVAFNAFATEYRIYCQSNGIVTEHRPDQNYNADNVIVKGVSWFVISENQIPEYKYSGQLRCQGSSLVVDPNYKPEYVIRQEQISEAQSELDAELGKAEPDVVTVLRLQRSIEKLKSGDVIQQNKTIGEKTKEEL